MVNFWNQVLVTSLVVLAWILITLAIYYFFRRSSYQRQKEHFEDLHLNLAPGQKVEFSNGLIGIVDKVGSEFCDLRIKSGGLITVSRFAISRIIKEED